jgi:hypothetical protein
MTQGSSPTASATSFGFDSTAAEVVNGIKLSGKRAVVTGASSGLGSKPLERWRAPGPM